MAEYLKFNSPIHNLQVFLRSISNEYNSIPSVIPDGVYGNSTKEAVAAFQKEFSLNQTGETDNSTWDRIVNVYMDIDREKSNSRRVRIYPEHGLRPENNSYTPTVYIIQTMILALSERFDNIPEPSVNGVIDTPTANSIKSIQIASGLNPDGNITKLFWDYLSAIYETFVSTDRVDVADLY